MPKYYASKIHGYYLYFTSHCVLEAMHVHANEDGELRESEAAKFFVRADGTIVIVDKGNLSKRIIRLLQAYIQKNYKEMYESWRKKSRNAFYIGGDHISYEISSINKSTTFASKEEKVILDMVSNLYLDINIGMLIDVTVLSKILDIQEDKILNTLKNYL